MNFFRQQEETSSGWINFTEIKKYYGGMTPDAADELSYQIGHLFPEVNFTEIKNTM